MLRIRSWKEARRPRRPFGSLRTCRATAQKLLNKRFVLTYGIKLAVLRTYIPVYTHIHARACVCTSIRACIHTSRTEAVYWFRPRALSAYEYAGARWFSSAQPPCFTPLNPGQSRLGIVSGKGWPTAGSGMRGNWLSPCLYRTIFDDSVARHASVSTDCRRFMNKVDARALCDFTISHSRSYTRALADNRRRPKRRTKVYSDTKLRLVTTTR